jgi:myo-inositol-1(or 4)-monophosphatase
MSAMPPNQDTAAALEAARRAARAGGAILRSYFGRRIPAREKRGDDLLTEADLAAEATIVAVLRAATPEIAVVSEESGGEITEHGLSWLIDPLDGTNNFVVDMPQIGVSIALMEQGSPVLGVVHHPITETLWEAVRSGGARRNGAAIDARHAVEPRRAVVAHIQGYPVGPDLSQAVQGLLRAAVKRVLTNWAPALDWCLVAEGRVDALVSLDSEPEDLHAGVLIAQEAGAIVTDFAGRPYTPGAARVLGAGAPALHTALVDRLREFAS